MAQNPEAFRLALAAMCQAELTLGGEGCQGVPNLTGISAMESYRVVSQYGQGSVFTVHFALCTNFESSKNPGRVSDPVIFLLVHLETYKT